MLNIKNLLELRTKIKSKKPHFIRQDYQRRKRLGRKLKWRKPKGIHSKIRHRFKGRRKMPSPGYKSPRKVKGLHASGLRIVNVSTVNELAGIRKEKNGIIISKQVGAKKKLEILKKAKELNIAVLNLNADEHIKKIEDFINSKKKIEKKTEPKETKKEEAKVKKEVKAEIKEISSDAEIQLLAAESVSGKEEKEKMPKKLSDEQKKEAKKKEKPPEKVMEEEKKEEEKKEAEKKEKDEILTKRI